LHEWLAVVCNLPRIQATRYDIELPVVNHVSAETSFTSLLTEIPEGLLAKAYEIVEEKLKEVSKYVSKWLQFQSLWDLGDTDVYKRLGDDLSEWQKILAELKKSRTTFDNEEKERSFGPTDKYKVKLV